MVAKTKVLILTRKRHCLLEGFGMLERSCPLSVSFGNQGAQLTGSLLTRHVKTQWSGWKRRKVLEQHGLAGLVLSSPHPGMVGPAMVLTIKGHTG